MSAVPVTVRVSNGSGYRPNLAAVGTLELTGVTSEGDDLVFDPMRLTDGIEPTDDPILRYRPRVYAQSHEQRTAPE